MVFYKWFFSRPGSRLENYKPWRSLNILGGDWKRHRVDFSENSWFKAYTISLIFSNSCLWIFISLSLSLSRLKYYYSVSAQSRNLFINFTLFECVVLFCKNYMFSHNNNKKESSVIDMKLLFVRRNNYEPSRP